MTSRRAVPDSIRTQSAAQKTAVRFALPARFSARFLPTLSNPEQSTHFDWDDMNNLPYFGLGSRSWEPRVQLPECDQRGPKKRNTLMNNHCRRDLVVLPAAVAIGFVVFLIEQPSQAGVPWNSRASRTVRYAGAESNGPSLPQRSHAGFEQADVYFDHSQSGPYCEDCAQQNVHHHHHVHLFDHGWLRKCLHCDHCDEGRECACPIRPFCPQGHCKVRPTGGARLDYGRYRVKGRIRYPVITPVTVDEYPEFEPCCQNFWLKR